MRAFLHIGCEKTGTTSIQGFLQARADDIEAAGWVLPRRGRFPNATRLALACMDGGKSDPDAAHLDRRDRWRPRGHWRTRIWREVGRELATRPAPRLILSSEYFQARLGSDAELARLKARLADVGVREFRIVVYLRRQLEYAISRHSTALRAGYSHRDPLPDVGGSVIALYDYERLLERWSRAFGPEAMDVRIYAPAPDGRDDLIEDFASATGLPIGLARGTRPARHNAALSLTAQLSIRALNEALETRGISRERSAGLRAQVLERLSSSTDDGALVPTREQAIAFQSRFDAANARVARRWFERERLFDEVFDYPDTAPDRDALERLATAFAHGVVTSLDIRPGRTLATRRGDADRPRRRGASLPD